MPRVSAAQGGKTSHNCVTAGQGPGGVKVLVLGMGSDPGRATRSKADRAGLDGCFREG